MALEAHYGWTHFQRPLPADRHGMQFSSRTRRNRIVRLREWMRQLFLVGVHAG